MRGNTLSRRDLLIGAALLSTSAVGFALKPRRPDHDPRLDDLEAAIPMQIGAFAAGAPEGFILPALGSVATQTYVNVLTRLYRSPGELPVMLLVARGKADDPGMTVHRPERCYRASGFSIRDRRQASLPAPFPAGAGATCMTAERDRREEQVFFWTRVGNHYPTSGLDQRIAMIEENLAGVLPMGLLVRLSIVHEDAGRGFGLLEKFNAAMLAAMTSSARAGLLGLR